MVVNKLNDSLDVIWKIEDYIQQPEEVFNKAKLFNTGLSKNLVRATKVIPVLVDFSQKMDDLLTDIQSLFDGLEAQQPLPLDQVPNFSINMEKLTILQGWEMRNVRGSPTSTKLAQPSKSAKDVDATPREWACESKDETKQDPIVVARLELQPTPTEQEDECADSGLESQYFPKNHGVVKGSSGKIPKTPRVPNGGQAC